MSDDAQKDGEPEPPEVEEVEDLTLKHDYPRTLAELLEQQSIKKKDDLKRD